MFSSAVSTGHEVEGLEDEAEPVAAQLREPLVVEAAELLRRRSTTEPEVGRVEPGQQVHQRGLAGARRPHDRRELTGGEADASRRRARATAVSPSP